MAVTSAHASCAARDFPLVFVPCPPPRLVCGSAWLLLPVRVIPATSAIPCTPATASRQRAAARPACARDEWPLGTTHSRRWKGTPETRDWRDNTHGQREREEREEVRARVAHNRLDRSWLHPCASDLPLCVLGEHSEGNILGKERPPRRLHTRNTTDESATIEGLTRRVRAVCVL